MPNRFLNWLYEDGYPLTKGLIIATVAVAILNAFFPIASWLAFIAPSQIAEPWRMLTYPLVMLDPISLIFYSLWIYFICGSLERSWGTRTFGIFFAAVTAISAAGLTIGALLTRTQAPVGGYVAVGAAFLAWAMLNPNLEIRLMGIIPILAKWLAAIDVAIIFFTYARINPLLGVFALFGCFAAYLWTRNRGWADSFSYAYRTPQPKKKRAPHDDDFKLKDLNPLERIARARRKKKFQRLFEDDDK